MLRDVVDTITGMRLKRLRILRDAMETQDISYIRYKIRDLAEIVEPDVPGAMENTIDVEIVPVSNIEARIRPNNQYLAWTTYENEHRYYYLVDNRYLICIKRTDMVGSMSGLVDPETGETYTRRDVYISRTCTQCCNVIAEKQLAEMYDFDFGHTYSEYDEKICAECNINQVVGDRNRNNSTKENRWTSGLWQKLKSFFTQTKA